jgi:hypothetical protein
MPQRLSSTFCLAILLTACGSEDLTANRSTVEVNEELVNMDAALAWAAAQPRPPAHIVDRIENLLASQPCIGRLDRWLRTYAFDDDRQIIAFHLEEAAPTGVRPGRQVTYPYSWDNLGEGPVGVVGDFDLADGQLRFASCGEATSDQFDSYWAGLERRRRTVAH